MSAEFFLGVDVGTTFTAAATHRSGRTEIAGLGNQAPPIPSLVFLREDGEILVGEAAERRGLAEPHPLAREFNRRAGDETPIMLAGSPYSADRLIAAVLRHVVDTVAAREGGEPAGLAVTHPANWGEFKTDVLRQACHLADLRDVQLVTEPVAAAVHYASTERVDPGAVVAVYDLGGGTFDAAVLRKTADGFTTLGEPEGIERLGGVDFDAAVFAHVRSALGGVVEDLDPDDPTARAAIARLRRDCVAAKEALSFDTDATVPVALPNVQTQIRLTRPEFEAMIRPPLLETIEVLRRALAGAGVTPPELAAVLLVGGSSRIPLVAEMVTTELGRPVAVDVHPKHAVALGAARVAAGESGETAAAPAVPTVVQETDTLAGAPAAAPAVPAAAVAPGDGGRARNKRVPLLVGAGVALVLLAVAAVALAQRGGGGSSEEASEETAPEAPVESPCGSASGRCASITGITIEDGSYVAIYEVANFEPDTSGDHHVHFFFDTTSAENAGSNGPSPGEWVVWDRAKGGGELRFDGLQVSGRGDATQLCVAVADRDHGVEADTASCVGLPEPAEQPRRRGSTPRRAATTTTSTAHTSTTAEPLPTTTLPES